MHSEDCMKTVRFPFSKQGNEFNIDSAENLYLLKPADLK